MNRSLFSGLTFFIFWAMSRIAIGPERVVEHARAVDRVEVGVDDKNMVLVAALGLRDHVPVISVGLEIALMSTLTVGGVPPWISLYRSLPDREGHERDGDASG